MTATETPTIQSLARQVYFAPQRRQRLQQNVDHLEKVRHDAATHPIGAAVNMEQLAQCIEQDRAMLDAGTPPEYDVRTKNKLYALRNQIIEAVSSDQDFLTHDEMERPTSQNVTRLSRWNQRHAQKFLALRSINRILDSGNDDPGFGSVAQFRDYTRPMGNPVKYWQGHDDIAWSASVEDDLAASVDDGLYMQFLELRMADWAAVNIQRKLSIAPKVYDACLRRWQQSRDAAAPVVDDESTMPDGHVRAPVPTPRLPDDPNAPAAVAARAVGADVPTQTVEAYTERWPHSELVAIGVSLAELCRIAKLDYRKIMQYSKKGTFPKDDMATLTRELERLQREHAAKYAGTARDASKAPRAAIGDTPRM